MSVPKTRRGESGAQFVDTARELEIFTLQQCMKFPKRITFFLSQPIVQLSQDVLNNVKAANSIFPGNAHEAQLRRDCLIAANNALQAMISQIDIAHGVVGDVPDKVWLRWMELIASEAKLISAVKAADKKRFENLK